MPRFPLCSRTSSWSEAVGLAHFAAGSARARRERQNGGSGGGGDESSGGAGVCAKLSLAHRTFSRAASTTAQVMPSTEEDGGGAEGELTAASAAAVSFAEPVAGGKSESSVSEADATLRRTFQGLACGCSAPPLPPALRWHVCVIHGEESAATCRSIASALEVSFAGAKVALTGPQGQGEGGGASEDLAVAAAGSARCVLLFLTRGILRAGSPQVAAARAALAAGARFVLVHETERAKGGSPTFNDYVDEARAAGTGPAGGRNLMDIFSLATSVPWHHDLDFLPVRTVTLPLTLQLRTDLSRPDLVHFTCRRSHLAPALVFR